jgi:hypothetical protein
MIDNVNMQAVPEPSTIAATAFGMLGFAVKRRKRSN